MTTTFGANSLESRSRNYALVFYESREGKTQMTKERKLGGMFTLSDPTMNVYRMGYGAMQLAGPQVFGPPRDVDTAIAVVFVLHASTDSIQTIYVMTNPEKLSHLPPVRSEV